MERRESIWSRNKLAAQALQKLPPCIEVYWWQQASEMLAYAESVYPDNAELINALRVQRDGYEQALIDKLGE